MKTYLQLISYCLLYNLLSAQTSQQWFIEFETNQSSINAQHEDILQEVIDFYTIHSIQKVELLGHTDNVGNKAYNQKLSLKRANSVKTYLTENGIDNSLITVSALDFSRPKADNSGEMGKATNRRTEIIFYYTLEQDVYIEPISSVQKKTKPQEPIIIEKPKVLEEITKEEIQEKEELVETPVENERIQAVLTSNQELEANFTFSKNKNYTIEGVSGTKIHLNSAAIKNKEKLEGKQLNFKIREYLSATTAALAGASTRSGTRLLKSAGMYCFAMVASDNSRVSGCVTIEIPSEEVEGMYPYLYRGGLPVDQINWRKAPSRTMLYDKTKGVYKIKYCGLLSRRVCCNVDKPVPASVVKIRAAHLTKAKLYVEYDDGTFTTVKPFEVNGKKMKKHFHFPLVDKGKLWSVSTQTRETHYIRQEFELEKEEKSKKYKYVINKKMRGRRIKYVKKPKFKMLRLKKQGMG